jgi:hypothetical protein
MLSKSGGHDNYPDTGGNNQDQKQIKSRSKADQKPDQKPDQKQIKISSQR